MKSCVLEGHDPGDGIGAIRRLEMEDVDLIREQLLALSDTDHDITFSIIEAQLPIWNYRSTLSLPLLQMEIVQPSSGKGSLKLRRNMPSQWLLEDWFVREGDGRLRRS